MLDTNFWKKYFQEYDLLNELIPYDELLESICSNLDIKNSEKILDAGSGTGNLSLKILTRGGKPFGIDYSPEGVEIHQEKMPGSETRVHDLQNTLPFPNDHFDKVTSNNTLYTIQKIKRPAIFKEFFRVLKPGGIIVVANLKTGFSPLSIYTEHMKKSVQQIGILKTLQKALQLLGPTIKIFYYNHLIKKEHATGGYDFFKDGEQRDELIQAGFMNVSDDQAVYAGQAILNKAYKPE